MYKDLLIEIVPILLIMLIVSTLAIKYYKMPKVRNAKTLNIILTSFLYHDKQTLKNTFHKQLKNYYRRNRGLNTFFYISTFTLITIYLLMINV